MKHLIFWGVLLIVSVNYMQLLMLQHFNTGVSNLQAVVSVVLFSVTVVMFALIYLVMREGE